jgi:hypothetical protein
MFCIDISLGGVKPPTVRELKEAGDYAVEFLQSGLAVKIVVIIDTHCIENGRFVWRGDSPANYEACSLPEVRG